MQARYNRFNPKRRIKPLAENELKNCSELAKSVRYGGNPEHKKNPGDFGLTPPCSPRQGKSLCDNAEIFSRKEALGYLRLGLEKGMISERFNGNWPQNIWSVTKTGMPLEAQLENADTGTYHGYPMPESDPLAQQVLEKWKTE